MTKRMLIDATHAEETRVVVLDGNRLDDYDVETSTKRQLKGNIYLAKIVRVEPSLQAAFVEYGGNRHGFLAFDEIHPDYYQLPVADRQRLIALQEAEAREEEEAEEAAMRAESRPGRAQPAGRRDAVVRSADADHQPVVPEPMPGPDRVVEAPATDPDMAVPPTEAVSLFPVEANTVADLGADLAPEAAEPMTPEPIIPEPAASETIPSDEAGPDDLRPAGDDADDAGGDDADDAGGVEGVPSERSTEGVDEEDDGSDGVESVPAEAPPEQVGGDADVTEDAAERRPTPRFLRNYKIQEVIRRRQILLIQVVKEERGTKGAALTTYISLAGRFSVLMPNSPRGGGISRKITSAADRRRLKEVTAELDLPRGMGLIVRTAGANRPKPEIMRDGEYLLDQWDQIRDLTMRSTAPALIYEEANLIKRSIRDVYSRDVDDILVDGEVGWRAARDFMRMLMPTHARKVQLWREPQPLFAKQMVEAQLDAMLSPVVQLKSGGYLVIDQTEALVAIDVNSGRSTRERGIEATALGTNLEAADEVARQLRLRDLAGLIVIDFIDMEARRANTQVEARLKTALKDDRARIQVGSISHFGLLEMSRQRLRPSLAETSFVACPSCGGTGHVRSTESAALHVLRGIEDEGAKRRSAEVVVHVASAIALYILNHKRGRLAEIEARYGMRVAFASDDTLLPPTMRIEKVRAAIASELPAPVSQIAPIGRPGEGDNAAEEDDTEIEAVADDAAEDDALDPADAPQPGEAAEDGGRGRKRRRRRGRGRREDGTLAATDPGGNAEPSDDDDQPDPPPVEIGITAAPPPAFDLAPAHDLAPGDAPPVDEPAGDDALPGDDAGDEEARSKRRGRRGGRRRRRDAPEGGEEVVAGATTGPDLEAVARPAPPAQPTPSYSGPTPADPFGGSQAFDIFDAIEQAEQQREALATAPRLAPLPMALDRVAEPRMPDLDPEPEPARAVAMADPEQGDPDPEFEFVAAEPEAAVAAPLAPEVVEPEPEPAAAAENAPTLVDGGAMATEKKRGWWRR